MKDKKEFMQEAINLAKKNLKNPQGGPFGAIVVKNGKIIGKGFNTVIGTNDPSAHAEVNAIREACKTLGTYQLDDCEIYSSCEPCPMCLGAIYWSRINKIYYAANRKHAMEAGFDDSFIYDQINILPAKRMIPATKVMEDEAAEVFKTWIKQENNIEY
jgi:tRNA(Arg) A34 adenosine deaminase TadA